VRFEVVGVLDGLSGDQIPDCGPDGYPLETRLREGTRVVVDAAFIETRLQRSIEGLDDQVAFHLVLCAGLFPKLSASQTLIQPFEVAVTKLQRRGLASLEILVPFGAQEMPAVRKWEAAGFDCRARVLADKPDELSIASWVMDAQAGTSADALVFDYVGFPAVILDDVAAAIDIPVFDLGHLALDFLERKLQTP